MLEIVNYARLKTNFKKPRLVNGFISRTIYSRPSELVKKKFCKKIVISVYFQQKSVFVRSDSSRTDIEECFRRRMGAVVARTIFARGERKEWSHSEVRAALPVPASFEPVLLLDRDHSAKFPKRDKPRYNATPRAAPDLHWTDPSTFEPGSFFPFPPSETNPSRALVTFPLDERAVRRSIHPRKLRPIVPEAGARRAQDNERRAGFDRKESLGRWPL